MKIRLMDIVLDPSIQVREVEPFTVSKYVQSMREGAVFPPLLLEEKSNRIVCGNHRYTAYKKILQPESKVEVVLRKFAGEAEIIRTSAKDNATHGRPLDTWDMKRVAARLRDLGDKTEGIAAMFNIPVKKVEQWAGMSVVVIGKGKSRYTAPVKHGLEHLAGKTIQAKDYESHKQHDYGIPIKNMAAIITRHLQSRWIASEDVKTVENLQALYTELGDYLKVLAAT